VTLIDFPEGAVVEISALRGGAAFTQRLHALGFFTGSMIRLVKAAPFHGPLMIEDVTTGARIMIGRGMASKIEVCRGEQTKR
jgi:Fe2+ transport system protein FeoA